MRSEFGRNIKVTIFGGSHEEKIGCIVEGLPAEALDFDGEKLQSFLDLRAPGNSPLATRRKEPDKFEIESSDPLTMIIRNTDIRPGDYGKMRSVPRPGHADYTARVRYGSELNMSGGGPFSARMTAPLCMAGGVALQYLEKKGIRIGAHILSIGDICDLRFDPMDPDIDKALESLNGILNAVDSCSGQDAREERAGIRLPVLDEEAGVKMAGAVLAAANEGDSLGGIVEVAATGLPAGIGGAMYDGIESILSPVYFGIPAVKGVEFGAGFGASRMRGSENNDPFDVAYRTIVTKTNNAGGILGGITTGMPFTARLGFKPTPSISRAQESVDLDKMERAELKIKGRHDPCVAVRAVPIVMAATAIGLLDAWLDSERSIDN